MTPPPEHERASTDAVASATAGPTTRMQLALAWALVGVPLAWGVWQVVLKSLALFRR